MASANYWVRRLRQTRRETRRPATRSRRPTGRFEGYELTYRAVLGAVRDLAGEDALDELGEWMVDSTGAAGSLPAPSAVRDRARQVCDERGIEIPAGSPLSR